MVSGSTIKSVYAREVFSERGHPGIETTVMTEDGASGVALVTAGVSIGKHEAQFIYDGGERWGGRGVLKAVENVNKIIALRLVGMDATNQRAIDENMIRLDGTADKSKLGGNATASVSAAVLKAAANSLEIPLYQHIGGVNACILPVPGVGAVIGSDRYNGGKSSGGKPSYSFLCYGFKNFAEASYACWEVKRDFDRVLQKRYGITSLRPQWFVPIPPSVVQHDRELWESMTEAIENVGYKERVGIQVDIAACTYYEKEKNKFVGLFSKEDKTKEDLIELYKETVATYPFIVIEDPLDQDDFEGHAVLARELGIEIVGDDLFTTNIARVRKGIELKACNAVLLKVNQIGTISEALDMCHLAFTKGYGVMPCSSRGEGVDIADYAVGLNTGQIRESGVDFTANRLLRIESELESSARFLGKAAFKTQR